MPRIFKKRQEDDELDAEMAGGGLPIRPDQQAARPRMKQASEMTEEELLRHPERDRAEDFIPLTDEQTQDVAGTALNVATAGLGKALAGGAIAQAKKTDKPISKDAISRVPSKPMRDPSRGEADLYREKEAPLPGQDLPLVDTGKLPPAPPRTLKKTAKGSPSQTWTDKQEYDVATGERITDYSKFNKPQDARTIKYGDESTPPEAARVLDYSPMKWEAERRRYAAEKAAPTIDYSSGTPVIKPPKKGIVSDGEGYAMPRNSFMELLQKDIPATPEKPKGRIRLRKKEEEDESALPPEDASGSY